MFATKEWVKNLLSKVLKKKLNNYSLEEQRVGTWIDGKPLYQKTIKCTSPSTTNESVEIYKDETMEHIVNISGTSGAGEARVPVNYENIVSTWYRGSSHSIIMSVTHINYTNAEVYLTIQYTKTTDAATIQ
jgi:hypothetical protein